MKFSFIRALVFLHCAQSYSMLEKINFDQPFSVEDYFKVTVFNEHYFKRDVPFLCDNAERNNVHAFLVLNAFTFYQNHGQIIKDSLYEENILSPNSLLHVNELHKKFKLQILKNEPQTVHELYYYGLYYNSETLLETSCLNRKKYQQRGRDYLLKAAQQEFLPAYYGLGLLYLNGLGVTKDIDKARDYFKETKEKYPPALFALGLLHKKYSQKKYKKEYSQFHAQDSHHYFIKCARLNYLRGLFDPMERNIKLLYKTKIDVFKKAAKNNVCYAQLKLGQTFLHNKNYKKSYKYLSKAAQQNNAQAKLCLGLLLSNPSMGHYHPGLAAYLLKKSPKNNEAQFRLAELYCTNKYFFECRHLGIELLHELAKQNYSHSRALLYAIQSKTMKQSTMKCEKLD